MLLDSEIFLAYLLEDDWLHDVALQIITKIKNGELVDVNASSSIFHELYYILSEFVTVDLTLQYLAKIKAIKNINFLDTTSEDLLTAISFVESFRINSFYSAIYIAQALSDRNPDRIIISTNTYFDRIKSLKRIDPREMIKKDKED